MSAYVGEKQKEIVPFSLGESKCEECLLNTRTFMVSKYRKVRE